MHIKMKSSQYCIDYNSPALLQDKFLDFVTGLNTYIEINEWNRNSDYNLLERN